MPQTFDIDVQVLRALLPLAAEGDIRGYLNGVLIEFEPKRTIYVATDGKALGRYIVDGDVDNTCSAKIIVPREVVKQLKVSRTLYTGQIVVEGEPDANGYVKQARLLNPGSTQDIGFQPIDGRYPEISRVIPDKASGEAGNYDVDLLAKFSAVNKAFGAKHPGIYRLRQNGPSGVALVDLKRESFTGVIIPVRL